MSSFDLVIRGGTVVTAADRFPADIGVRDEALDRGEVICREFEFVGRQGAGRFLRCEAPNRPASWRPPGGAVALEGAAALTDRPGVS